MVIWYIIEGGTSLKLQEAETVLAELKEQCVCLLSPLYF